MQKLTLAGIALMLCWSANTVAQESFSDRAKRYIETYREMAVAEQRRSGVPAAITLGQGIYETSAGASELATEANNHFGIKCKKEWTGETFAHTDDAPDECFRKYRNAEDSYRDHSDYLKTSARYQSCFRQSPTDYAAWARELKKCGYATNPQYAQRLIKIIEDYKLQEYTYLAMNEGNDNEQPAVAEVIPEQDAPAVAAATVAVDPGMAEAVAENVPAPATAEGNIAPAGEARPVDDAHHLNGLKGFYARKGDVLLEQAIKNNIRYSRLLELNDLPDAPLSEDMFIYLERKHSKGARPFHIVQPGETMIRIAQNEGIQLRQLRAYNQLDIDEQPAAGVALQLQKYASSRPGIVRSNSTQRPVPQYASHTAAAVQSEYISTGNQPALRTQPVAAEVPAQQPVPAMKAPAADQKGSAIVVQEKGPEPTPVAQVQPATFQPAVNIADEAAVEEEDREPAASAAPGPEEPQDELSRLKAKLDKAVYGQGTPRKEQAVAAPAPVQQAPAASAQAAKSTQYYTVQKGDTAFSIARKHNISMRQLMDWNDLNFDAIKVGQKLKVSP